MLVQSGGHQVFKAQAAVAHHQTGVVKVNLGRLQHGTCNVVVKRAHHKDDVERLQNVEVFFKCDGRDAQVAPNAGQRQGRAHTRAQHFGKQTNGVDLLNARELQHIVAHQAIKVLPAPAFGLFVVGGQAWFWKAATLKQMRERRIGRGPGLCAPFAHRYRVQSQPKEAPSQ